jgi:hypothetical protein
VGFRCDVASENSIRRRVVLSCHSNSVRIASPLRADMIFGKDTSSFLARDGFSISVAQLQRFDRHAWATMLRGRSYSEVIKEISVRRSSRGDLINWENVHAPPLFSCRRDVGDRAASCAARVCVLDRSHKWHESRWFPPLCGSRRSNPFFFLRRVGRKRGRLGRSKFSPSNRLPFAGWNQSGDHISQLVLPDIAASVNTSARNFSGAVSPRRPDCRG